LADGLHDAIIDEELWSRVRKKRIAIGVKKLSKVGKDRAYLLTGILKCPVFRKIYNAIDKNKK